MADLQVTCINKLNRNSTHEGITHLGGATWAKKTRQQVITDIESGTNTYYTLVGGKRATVGVISGRSVTSRSPRSVKLKLVRISADPSPRVTRIARSTPIGCWNL